MRPIADLDAEEARGLAGLLFDLDDTLLDHGKLGESAYSALFRLCESGLSLVAVTGRPAGWGEVLARQWPIRAAVTENGAIALRRTEEGGIEVLDRVSAEERERRARGVRAIAEQLMSEIPELDLADDVRARISDLTFDIGERRQIDRATVARATAFARNRGAHVVTSSVHLHVSLDGDDKASGAVHCLSRWLGEEPTRALSRWAFIGDSENDAACFAAFRTTIGVANLRGRMSVPPRYATRGERGAGFAEAARVLCNLRRG